jgi:hypothetical protein
MLEELRSELPPTYYSRVRLRSVFSAARSRAASSIYPPSLVEQIAAAAAVLSKFAAKSRQQTRAA